MALPEKHRFLPFPIHLSLSLFVLAVVPAVEASTPRGWNDAPVEIHVPPYRPVVLPGARLGALQGIPAERIVLFAQRHGEFIPIPFQIDRKDASGRHLIIPEQGTESPSAALDAFDECVFMADDAGLPISQLPESFAAIAVQAIRVHSGAAGGWVYALAFADTPPPKSPDVYVHYDAERDAISTDAYRAAFSPDLPFLIDRFQWKISEAGDWSPNLADTMKVRHTGKLFGAINFKRSQADYRSQLISVKQGPIRIIRRTRNSVRMMLGMRTPSLLIDYIAYRRYAVMDTIIDLPFPIGWFFSHVETLTTMDLRNDPGLREMRILHRAVPGGIALDGVTPPGERNLEKEKDTDYVIANNFGQILVQLDIDKELPIQKRVYFVDNQELPDPPENVPGQFGNSGYATTGWEDVGRGVHHMQFSFTIVPAREQPRGMALLE